jgi:hypothetical protein
VPFVVSRKILVKKSSSYCISAAEGGLYWKLMNLT